MLKKKVAALLDEFLLDTFEMAGHAITVDGEELGVDSRQKINKLLLFESSEQTEPFDFELNGQLRSLLQQIEEETVQVTKLRREMPAKAGLTYDELVHKTDKEVTDILKEMDAYDTEEEPEKIPPLDSTNYNEALIRLNRLKHVLPQRKQEIDRLNETILFLEQLNGR